MHAPLQKDDVSNGVAPYRPKVQLVHTPLPPALNCPGPQGTAVELVEPDGHAYPGVHGPLQRDDVKPAAAPYRPASHGPLQFDDAIPTVEAYLPVGHGTHCKVSLAAYWPNPQLDGDGDVDPGGQSAPGVHSPLQRDDVRPGTAPYRPASHGPLQLALVSPGVAPYSPAGHMTHAAAPAGAY